MSAEENQFLIPNFTGDRLLITFVEMDFDAQVYFENQARLITGKTYNGKSGRLLETEGTWHEGSDKTRTIFHGQPGEAVKVDEKDNELIPIFTETKYPGWCALLGTTLYGLRRSFNKTFNILDVSEMGGIRTSRLIGCQITYLSKSDLDFSLIITELSCELYHPAHKDTAHYMSNQKYSGKWDYDNIDVPENSWLSPYFEGVEFGTRGLKRFNQTHIAKVLENVGIDIFAPDLFVGRYFYLRV